MKGKVDSFNSLNSLCIVHITSSLICLSISLFFHSFIHSFLSVFLYWFIYLWYHAIVISLLKRAIKEEWNQFWFYMKQLKEDLIDLIHQLFALLKDRCMEGRICRHDKFKVMYFFYIFFLNFRYGQTGWNWKKNCPLFIGQEGCYWESGSTCVSKTI